LLKEYQAAFDCLVVEQYGLLFNSVHLLRLLCRGAVGADGVNTSNHIETTIDFMFLWCYNLSYMGEKDSLGLLLVYIFVIETTNLPIKYFHKLENVGGGYFHVYRF